MRSSLALLALSALLGVACGYRPVDVESLAITTPPLAAPPRIAAPLFLIRDSARIPQTMTATAPGGPEIVVENLPLLLERDLKTALGALFESVTVVDPSAQVPAGDRLVGLFAVEELSLAQQGGKAGEPRWVGAVRFRFELWLPGAETQAYRFAGTAVGAVALGDRRSGDQVFASAFASAIHRVADGIARSGAAARLSARKG
jgi:hypothetical protein